MKLNGAALKLVRERTGVTMADAATRADVSTSAWSRWESGDRNASMANMRTICDVLLIDDMTAICTLGQTQTRTKGETQ